jgi:DNA-binding transcriptional LysR family regulator
MWLAIVGVLSLGLEILPDPVMSMDLIAALRIFLRVADTGSFSAVAAELGVTQPAISRQVSGLEQHLGARLVHRSTRSVTLTEEGRDLIRPAQQLIDSAEALQQSVGRCRSKPVGRVRLSVPVPLGLYLSSHIGQLLDKSEHLSIDLVLRDGVSDLVEEGLDLEVRVGPVADSALISRRIGSTTALLVAAPQYLRGRTLPAHPRDLQEHDCIVYPRWGQDDVWWFSSAEGNISVSVRGRLRANNATAVHWAVLNGRGIALVSHLLASEDIQQGRLQALMPEFPPRSFPLSVVYPSRRNLPLRTRAVIEFLTEVVRADPAMSNLGVIANEAQEPEVPGQQFPGDSLSAS